MNVGSAVSSIERNLHSHGFKAAIYDVVVRAANSFVSWKNIQCIVSTEPDPKCMGVVPPYRPGSEIDIREARDVAAAGCRRGHPDKRYSQFTRTEIGVASACEACLGIRNRPSLLTSKRVSPRIPRRASNKDTGNPASN
jgi:hypothetical protein